MERKRRRLSSHEIEIIMVRKEMRSKIIDYVNKRITELTNQRTDNEYEYTQKLGQMLELEQVLKFSRSLKEEE
jgi:hypothetical protein